MIAKTLRLPDPLVQKIIDDVKQQGLESENEWFTKACEHFLACKKLEHAEGMKLMILRYPATCLKNPEHHIEAGQWALYGRGVGAVCIDCYVGKLGDKALIAKFLKSRELDQINKALLKENERLADRFEILAFGDKLEQIYTMNKEQRELIFKYIKEPFPSDQEKQAFEHIIQESQKQDEIIRDVETFLQKHIKIKRKPVEFPQAQEA
jgi:hypothetical protein